MRRSNKKSVLERPARYARDAREMRVRPHEEGDSSRLSVPPSLFSTSAPGRRGHGRLRLTRRALDPPGSSPGLSYYVVFLGKTVILALTVSLSIQ